jgi:hypothetical protein
MSLSTYYYIADPARSARFDFNVRLYIRLYHLGDLDVYLYGATNSLRTKLNLLPRDHAECFQPLVGRIPAVEVVNLIDMRVVTRICLSGHHGHLPPSTCSA